MSDSLKYSHGTVAHNGAVEPPKAAQSFKNLIQVPS